MKFSWKLINHFIDMQNISLDKLTERLTLSGIEIEEIKYIKEIKDNILDLSLTTNRKEICSTLSLAEEISIILNKPLTILPIYFFKTATKKQKIQVDYNNVMYISISTIHNITIQKKPQWLNRYLEIYNISTINTINSIQQYIQIKWGLKFHILDENQLTNIKSILKNNINLSQIDLMKLRSKTNKHKFIIFISNNNTNRITTSNYKNYYWNSYVDAMKLISTITGCTHGKSYHQYKIAKASFNQIHVNKKDIDTILGRTKDQKLEYLSSKNIILILKQLTLFQNYNKFLQKFTVKIPNNRQHDLHRKIDIIEEIGRINGFYNFFDKLPLNTYRKGYASNLSIKIKNIRNILRKLGFNEVVNTSLIDNYYKHNINTIKLYNPIIKEQNELRSNIAQNLIKNCQNHIKQNNNNLQIFEIGKTFQKQHTNLYIENITLGGLIHNDQFIRNNWSDTPKYASLFHIKGIIETLAEQLNAQITLGKISKNQNVQLIQNIQTIFHPNKKIGIYNRKNQELLGILGEINPLYDKKLYNKEYKIYIFEINIERLYKNIQTNNHLCYISERYSNYPSVTRDISIKIRQNIGIKHIKEFFSKEDNSLIEEINISNEYFNRENQYKSITIRVTYRSHNRTLNKYDIQTIDKQINKILWHFESKT